MIMKFISTARMDLASSLKLVKSIPCVKLLISEIASKISRIRARQSLGDTNCFPHDMLSKMSFQTGWSAQVNGTIQQFLKVILQRE